MTAIVSKRSYLQQHVPGGVVGIHSQVQSSMDIPPLFELPPGPAAECIMIMHHLSKHDRQQLALSCKHAHTLAAAGVSKLTLGHTWHSGSQCRTVFPNCSSVTLKPRTVDEFGKLTTRLLINKVQRLPALVELQLDLQDVYDKMWDISLMLKSIVLHIKQLTTIHIAQQAMVSTKALEYLAELPALTSMTFKTAHGFEIGALASLGRVSGTLTSLTLEITDGCLGSPAAVDDSTKLPPSELARLQASDEVGLAKCVRLLNLTVINFTRSGTAAFRPVEALLQAIAGRMEPRLERLTLSNMPDMPISVLDAVAEISSLQEVNLAGTGLGRSPGLATLSVLGRLQALNVAPQQPTMQVLEALAKGCQKLSRLAMGADWVSSESLELRMPELTELQLLAASPHGAAAGGSSTPQLAGAVSSSAEQVKPPLRFTGLSRMWPQLMQLEISGYSLDAAAVSEVVSLRGLERLKIVGAPDAAVSARVMLPLLNMPLLQQLQLLELTDLTDCWISEAIRAIGTTPGTALAAIRGLQLGAAARSADLSNSGSCTKSGSSSDQATTASTLPNCTSSQHLTDKGLVRLFACPKLQKLSLVQLPEITLAGVKALVRGSQTLQFIDIKGCSAVSAASAEAVAKIAAMAPGRSVIVNVH